MTPEELLREARSLGAAFRFEGDKVVVSAPLPLPGDLMAKLREHKPEIVALLGQEPDYQATACTCESPVGSTGEARCCTCGLPLICPHCGLCRGCKLRLKYPQNGDWR